ncbi:esterase, partial [Actinomyces oris]
CSDTEAGGKAATYLEKDVPAWIRANLQVDDDPTHWAVAGLSNGGTCAMQVVTRSPGVYRTFLAISAEEHPTLGGVERTVSQGFGGDRAAYEANDPISLMSTAPPGRYDGIAGILSVGRQDKGYRGAVPVLAEAATKSGMTVSTRQYDGAHTWAVWGPALADQLDWLGGRLGIASPSPVS